MAHRLRQAGARPSDRRSKVATVLNMAAACLMGALTGCQALAGPKSPPGREGREAPAVRRSAP